jgi:hypothetical protein
MSLHDRWDNRIDQLEKGELTAADLAKIGLELNQWHTCLVGEVLHDAGICCIVDLPESLADELAELGGGATWPSPLIHPWILVERGDHEGLRNRLLRIRLAVETYSILHPDKLARARAGNPWPWPPTHVPAPQPEPEPELALA